MRRTWCAVGMAVTILATSAWVWADVAPPPRPPAGWESDVAPGFTPSIESVVSKISDDRYVRPIPEDADAKLAALWRGWGKDAVPVVTRLYEDPRWEKFKNAALELLLASPLPEATAYVEHRIRQLAGKAEREEQEVRELGTLCNRLVHRHPAKAWPILKELSRTDDETTLNAVAYALLLMQSEESVAEAKNIIARLPEHNQKQLTHSLEFFEAQMRANEPMERILRKESEGSVKQGESK